MAVYICGEAEKIFQVKDSQKIVLDEIVGLQFTCFMISPTPAHVIAAFALFRLFDIFKPFPVGLCQELPGGCGVVADDVAAGVYANVVLLLAIHFLYI